MPLDSPDDGGFGDSPGGEPEDEQRAGPDVRPLPFGLDRLDADRDTQVGQFEWRTGFEARGVRAADATATFVLLDSNNDGFLTREEFDGAVGTGTAAADRTEAQTTAMASLTALLNTAAGGNTPAGQVATLPPHADDP